MVVAVVVIVLIVVIAVVVIVIIVVLALICCSRCYCRPGVVVLLNIQCSNLGHKDGVKDMIKGN